MLPIFLTGGSTIWAGSTNRQNTGFTWCFSFPIKRSGVGYEHLCALYRCSPWPRRITALHQLASPSDSDDCEVSLSWLEIVHIPIDLLSGRSGVKCYSGSWPPMLSSRHTGVRRSTDDDMMDYSSHCQPSQNQSAADKVHAHSQPQALFVLLRQRCEVRVIGVVWNLQRMSFVVIHVQLI